jgi:hypothetical protein
MDFPSRDIHFPDPEYGGPAMSDYRNMRILSPAARTQIIAELQREYSETQFKFPLDEWAKDRIATFSHSYDSTAQDSKRWGDDDYLNFRKMNWEKIRELLADFKADGRPIRKSEMQSSLFDQQFYALLRDSFPVSPYEASKSGVWEYLTFVVLPDVAHLRFDMFVEGEKSSPSSSQAIVTQSANIRDRHFGGERNTFKRLWVRSVIAGDRISWLNLLTEDNLFSFFDRPNLLQNREKAEYIFEALCTFRHFAIESGLGGQEAIIRDFLKRIVRLMPLRNLDALPNETFKKTLREFFEESIQELATGAEFKLHELFGVLEEAFEPEED